MGRRKGEGRVKGRERWRGKGCPVFLENSVGNPMLTTFIEIKFNQSVVNNPLLDCKNCHRNPRRSSLENPT